MNKQVNAVPFVLLYNIKKEKLNALRVPLVQMGIKGRTVKAEEYAHPIGYLLGMEGFSAVAAPSDSFSDEMLLLAGLSNAQLDYLLASLRQRHCSVALKAVLTDTNVQWSSLALHKELVQEREAICNMQEAEKKSIHKQE